LDRSFYRVTPVTTTGDVAYSLPAPHSLDWKWVEVARMTGHEIIEETDLKLLPNRR
jgi:hypothetical protein